MNLPLNLEDPSPLCGGFFMTQGVQLSAAASATATDSLTRLSLSATVSIWCVAIVRFGQCCAPCSSAEELPHRSYEQR